MPDSFYIFLLIWDVIREAWLNVLRNIYILVVKCLVFTGNVLVNCILYVWLDIIGDYILLQCFVTVWLDVIDEKLLGVTR
jgi:hypothetical protein